MDARRLPPRTGQHGPGPCAVAGPSAPGFPRGVLSSSLSP
uniref:Serine protease 16 n=1 Tax=Myotis myotis TaxID=51298 RepID=A0A7J7SSS4_MYOMY|nr:serine protease 16 [Myotis myotis]